MTTLCPPIISGILHRPGSGLAPRRRRAWSWLVLVGIALLFWPLPDAYAQRVSGQIQGKVLQSEGVPAAGAEVLATNLDTAATATAIADAAGNYVLVALAPGQYALTIKASAGSEATELVAVATGQTVDFNVDLASATRGQETIRVSSTENKTSEVATNVSREQIESLPQSNRNFLNFATLAPAMRPSNDEFRKVVSAGAQDAPQINVFVDGVSLKNNVLDGGVVGQDASRGNPFPQLAVSGFRVLTQNFKAEYEQAGSAIISTVTKSGGNDPHAEVFTSLQSKAMVASDPFADRLNQPKPDYARYQVGGLVSGPLIENKLFALFTYEGNYQNRANQVQIGNRSDENLAQFGRYEGSFTSPFREHLGFGKLTWVPSSKQTVDLSLSLRHETDVRSFGGTTSFENAENVRNDVFTTSLRHQWRLPSNVVNEATAQLMLFRWHPGAENPGILGQDYEGVIRIGGRDSDQDVRQRSITVRDDVTLPTLYGAGEHQIKAGAKVAFQSYDETKQIFGNPVFRYKVDPNLNLDFSAPYEAEFGFGRPDVKANNNQIGVYVQDDWRPTDQLTVNAGVRWDVETNPLNNDFRTPDDIRATLLDLAPRINEANGAGFFDVNNYLTDGTQRPIYLGAIQPRLGVSYDLLGDQQTVVFGGAGRYYDRPIYLIDEVYRTRWQTEKIEFSSDGQPRNGQDTVMWNPAYLSKEGLQMLAAQGFAKVNLSVMANDVKPPHSDQYSFGVRQQLGELNLSATFSHVRSENGLGFYSVNRASTGDRQFLAAGPFGEVNAAADDIATRFTGVYLTADKPYSKESPWGLSATYTLGWAKVRGDAFNGYDYNGAYPTIKDTPFVPTNQDERHHLVVSGILGLPSDFKLATLIQAGSGLPFTIDDNSQGTTAGLRQYSRNGGRAKDFVQFSQIDFRLIKELKFGGQHATVSGEIFNILNTYNYYDYDGFIPAEGTNPNYGHPRRLQGPTRSFQIGLSYGF